VLLGREKGVGTAFIGTAGGEVRLGAAQQRPQQGRGVAGASWLDRRESTAAWRARVVHGRIHGRGGRFGHRPGGALPFGATHRQASPARWPAATARRQDRTGEEEEGKRRNREKE
jgi:hypothetical protein